MIETIIELLSEVKHPETGEDIINLGIVQNLKADENLISMNLV